MDIERLVYADFSNPVYNVKINSQHQIDSQVSHSVNNQVWLGQHIELRRQVRDNIVNELTNLLDNRS